MSVQFTAAALTDGDDLASLRVDAMRESLEAVGRFDPIRARERFLGSFDPQATVKIEREGRLIGFFVARILSDHIYLDHLYVQSSEQGQGHGAAVLEHVKALARSNQLPVCLCALRGSKANAFYKSHDFVLERSDEFDNYYRFMPAP